MLQSFEKKNEHIRKEFEKLKKEHPERIERDIDLSWSIWMFGQEPLQKSLERLKKFGLDYVELKGGYFTEDFRPDYDEILKLLEDFEMKVSGVCGLYSASNDLSSSDPYIRQRAVDYIKRQIEFVAAVGGAYLIVVPSAVGKPGSEDEYGLDRSAEALRKCGDYFLKFGVKAAIEPIRSAEVSLVHTVDDTLRYIDLVAHEGIRHINGDVYHMINEEEHVGEAILKAGDKLINLHIADSNRNVPGKGVMDFDVVLMASYLVGMNEEGRFLTFEPLGPFADPYVLLMGRPDPNVLDEMVKASVEYIRQREAIIKA